MVQAIFPQSTEEIPLFARGFYITRNESVEVPETYSVMKLGQWSYYYDFLTEPQVAESGGAFVVLHGNFASLQQLEKRDVAEAVLKAYLAGRDGFYEFLDDLAGRWALFVSRDGQQLEVFHDAFGNRTVYYSPEKVDVASHVDFISRNYGFEANTGNDYFKNMAANFNRTRSKGVLALVPNHRLVIDGAQVSTERFWPRESNPYMALGHSQKLDLISKYWDCVLAQYVKNYPQLLFSLSGGEDSRANLAMAFKYQKALDSFTYATHQTDGESYWYQSIRKDHDIVRQLVEFISMNHRFIFREDSDLDNQPELKKILNLNTTGQHGKWLLPLYRREFPGMRHMHMRGTLFEVGKAIYHDSRDSGELADMRRVYKNHTAKSALSQAEKDQFFDQKVKELELEPENYPSYLPSDIYYWEMRQGRWFSETLNESDLAFDSFVPISARRIAMLLLAFSLEERRSSFVFNELINRTQPVLNFIGKNNRKNLYEQMRDGDAPFYAALPRKKLLVFAPNGSNISEKQLADEESFQVPVAQFVQGNRLVARYVAREPIERAAVSWQSAYRNPRGRGVFEYRVYRNGELLFTQDGAATDRLMELGLGRLEAGDHIDLEIAVLATQTRQSWSAASRVSVFDVKGF